MELDYNLILSGIMGLVSGALTLYLGNKQKNKELSTEYIREISEKVLESNREHVERLYESIRESTEEKKTSELNNRILVEQITTENKSLRNNVLELSGELTELKSTLKNLENKITEYEISLHNYDKLVAELLKFLWENVLKGMELPDTEKSNLLALLNTLRAANPVLDRRGVSRGKRIVIDILDKIINDVDTCKK